MRGFAAIPGGKWHVAEHTQFGEFSTACGRYGFNVRMASPTFATAIPDDGEMCGACYKASLHIANAGGAEERYPVSGNRLGTGTRRY